MRNFQDASEISKRSFKEILNIKKKKQQQKQEQSTHWEFIGSCARTCFSKKVFEQ